MSYTIHPARHISLSLDAPRSDELFRQQRSQQSGADRGELLGKDRALALLAEAKGTA